jgi:hypothetical protein
MESNGAKILQRTQMILIPGIVALATAVLGATQQNYFTDWPAGTSPKEVGKRVAERFVQSPHQDPKRIIYPEVCTWYGALTFSQLSGDTFLPD